ncbi:DUF3024 domain-containing protein [Comamonas thiooxydans]|uniref:DUF3024 domain-containing protein n=1 Tax=Comamonas thiooxydans TaxID=363952 RepID=A0A0E3CGX8_9BURK|nr:DUF3024 domain-containing protein [Comamonas thiooxydans]KGH12942.1 hypothetical protein P608_09890 [Comamonas thiooxydans]KGH24043.1 hypothetical protein P606_10105 [Comamonas thiooxydans]KGH25671.1 hypothetical protein P607_05480 [Comamonas thiooxydans]
MAFSEFEVRRISKVVAGFVEKRRPPEHVRDQLDLMFSIEEQSVLLLEKRRLMDGEVIERPFANASWVKTQKVWKLYWQRADLKWHSYEPAAAVPTIEAFCHVVDKDLYGCFWG